MTPYEKALTLVYAATLVLAVAVVAFDLFVWRAI